MAAQPKQQYRFVRPECKQQKKKTSHEMKNETEKEHHPKTKQNASMFFETAKLSQ